MHSARGAISTHTTLLSMAQFRWLDARQLQLATWSGQKPVRWWYRRPFCIILSVRQSAATDMLTAREREGRCVFLLFVVAAACKQTLFGQRLKFTARAHNGAEIAPNALVNVFAFAIYSAVVFCSEQEQDDEHNLIHEPTMRCSCTKHKGEMRGNCHFPLLVPRRGASGAFLVSLVVISFCELEPSQRVVTRSELLLLRIKIAPSRELHLMHIISAFFQTFLYACVPGVNKETKLN